MLFVDLNLSNSIFQYAIVKAEALPNLTFKAHHENLLCKNIPQRGPKTGKFTDVMYAQGQGKNDEFAARVVKTQDSTYDITTDCTLP